MAAGLAGVYGIDEAKSKMSLFSSARRREREAADRIYAACVDAARRPALFLGYGVPDTLQGRFEMLTLHLFPVLYRFMHDPGDDPGLARLISESLVVDMDSAFREMGVGDVTVPKRMRTLYRSFGGRITAYRQAYGDGMAALESAVQRNVFPDGDPDGRAKALAMHLQAAAETIARHPRDRLRAGDVPFPSLAPIEMEMAAS